MDYTETTMVYYIIERTTRAQSKCRGCHQPITKQALRIGRCSGGTTRWWHVVCLDNHMAKPHHANYKRLFDPTLLEGFGDLELEAMEFALLSPPLWGSSWGAQPTDKERWLEAGEKLKEFNKITTLAKRLNNVRRSDITHVMRMGVATMLEMTCVWLGAKTHEPIGTFFDPTNAMDKLIPHIGNKEKSCIGYDYTADESKFFEAPRHLLDLPEPSREPLVCYCDRAFQIRRWAFWLVDYTVSVSQHSYVDFNSEWIKICLTFPNSPWNKFRRARLEKGTEFQETRVKSDWDFAAANARYYTRLGTEDAKLAAARWESRAQALLYRIATHT